jgi:CheR methyltransferase, SAM binding domain
VDTRINFDDTVVTDEQWEKRYTVRGFGSDEGNVRFAGRSTVWVLGWGDRGPLPARVHAPGRVSGAALAPLPPDLVDRYFTPVGEAYQVKKRVRSLTVFGEHDLGQHASFPHTDLCVCRNVLIYFTPELQQRALPRRPRCPGAAAAGG